MKRLVRLSFILGLAILVAGFGYIFGSADWLTLASRILVLRVLMVSLAAVIILLVTLGILNRGKTRWTAFLFVAMLLFGSSVFDPATVGIVGVPVGLLLLGFCIWKLAQSSPRRVTR